MFVEMSKQRGTTEKMEHKLDRCLQLHNRVDDLEESMTSVNTRMLLLEYKSIDVEARSRRNNLIFNGFPEEYSEDCHSKVKKLLLTKLEIVDDIVIDRVHRLGRYNRGSTRAIIVAFRDYAMLEKILSNAYKLKNTLISINKDYPKEIAQARKSIWGTFKDLKRDHPNSKIQLLYPAKINKDRQTVVDMFPLWDKIMSGSRVPKTRPTVTYAQPTRTRQDQDDRVDKAQGNSARQSYDTPTPQATIFPANSNSAAQTGADGTASRSRSASVGHPRLRRSRSPNRRTGETGRRSKAPSREPSVTPSQQIPPANSQILRPWDNGPPQNSEIDPNLPTC